MTWVPPGPPLVTGRSLSPGVEGRCCSEPHGPGPTCGARVSVPPLASGLTLGKVVKLPRPVSFFTKWVTMISFSKGHFED